MESDSKSHEEQVSLGRNLQRLREILGVKQRTLAYVAGVSQQYISRLEQRETFGDDVLEKVAAALGVAPEVIRNFNEEQAVRDIQGNCDGPGVPRPYRASVHHFPAGRVVELFDKLLKNEKEKLALLSGVNKAIKDLGVQLHEISRREEARKAQATG